MSLVSDNIMNVAGYSPYCGRYSCNSFRRTRFNGSQFECHCGWKSQFPEEFIQKYKDKWNISLTKQGV